MSFTKDGQQIDLQGVPKPIPEEANIHQLQRLLSTDALDTYFHLQLISPSPISSPSTPIHHDHRVTSLLTAFAALF
jgi:hypothetical protein